MPILNNQTPPNQPQRSEWIATCDKGYQDAWTEINNEIELCPDPRFKAALHAKLDALSDETTKKIIYDFELVFGCDNVAFVTRMKPLLDLPLNSIPALLQSQIAERIEIRRAFAPHEISSQMREDLASFYGAARFQFFKGLKSDTAKESADRYLQQFEIRTTQAQTHVAKCRDEITESSDRAVQWCLDLTNYTHVEVALNKNKSHLMTIFRSFQDLYTTNQYEPWPQDKNPARIKSKAIEIINLTSNYVWNNMLFIDPKQPGFADETSVLRDTLIRKGLEYHQEKFLVFRPQPPGLRIVYLSAQP
jgi:hypothetical protein